VPSCTRAAASVISVFAVLLNLLTRITPQSTQVQSPTGWSANAPAGSGAGCVFGCIAQFQLALEKSACCKRVAGRTCSRRIRIMRVRHVLKKAILYLAGDGACHRRGRFENSAAPSLTRGTGFAPC
jgi:hypothetical protein